MENVDALDAAYSGLTSVVTELDDYALLLPTRCRGWTIADLLLHVTGDAQAALVAFATPTTASANVDFVSYWRRFPGSGALSPTNQRSPTDSTNATSPHANPPDPDSPNPDSPGADPPRADLPDVHSPGADPPGAHSPDVDSPNPDSSGTRDGGEAPAAIANAQWIRRSASAFQRPSGIVRLWSDTAPAAVRAARAFDAAGRLAAQGSVFPVADFVAILVTEAVVHHLDMIVSLPDAPPPAPKAVAIAVATMAGLVGPPGLPDTWDPHEALLKGTGRLGLSGMDHATLGDRARLFPLLG